MTAAARYLPTALAAALILGAGTLYGRWTNRWGYAPEFRRVVEALPRIPHDLGRWHGEDVEETATFRQQREQAEIEGCVLRRYVHRPTGTAITMMLVCGPTGPIATHNPEACYGGGGRHLVGTPATLAIPGGDGAGAPEATFLQGDFRKPGSATSALLKICWSYNSGGGWIGSDDPRMTFAGRPALFKLYLIRELADTGGSPPDDALTPEFLELLLPELDQILSLEPDTSEVGRPAT